MPGLRKGYPGLTSTADQIKQYIPTSDIYVEPFAGLGRTAEDRHKMVVLNDKSDYAVDYLKNNMLYAVVTQDDFTQCIKKWDSKDTFFLIDPPWHSIDYRENPKTFCDRGVGKYYSELRTILDSVRGNWIICGRALGGARSTVSVYFQGYPNLILEGNRTINGHKTKVKLYFKHEPNKTR